MRMRALKVFRYGGRSYHRGDELEMSDSHARTLQLLRKVAPVEATGKPSGTYKRRDMVSEPLDIPNFRNSK
jgi:hypothetical protein